MKKNQATGVGIAIISKDFDILYQDDIFSKIFYTVSKCNILENLTTSNSQGKYLLIQLIDEALSTNQIHLDFGIHAFKINDESLACNISISMIESNQLIIKVEIKNMYLSDLIGNIINDRKFYNLIESMPIGIARINVDLEILEINSMARNLLSIPKNIFSNLKISDYFNSEHIERLKKFYSEIDDENNIKKIEFKLKSHNKEDLFLEIKYYTIKNSNEFYLVIMDITDRVNYDNYLVNRVSRDSLTGLFSRNYLIDALDECSNEIKFGRMRGYALFVIDIDRFKYVNDSYTHTAGNEVLKIFSDRLANIFKDPNVIVCRLGGDEFSILKTHVTNTDSIEFECNKIRNILIEPIFVEDHSVSLTCSIGVSLGNKLINNADEVLRNSEIAMYDAKKNGRGRFKIYQMGMHEKVLKNLKMETYLRDAVVNDNLKLFLQPIVNTGSCNVTHYEALCRWEHSSMGFIPPIQFIPLAEETGQIHSIGDWMLLKVCKQIKSWESSGKQVLPISINLSPLQFEKTDLPEIFKRYLDHYSISADLINIELTESLIMSNVDYSKKVLKRLREMGIKIFLDDFGTGFSSLNYLVHFPIDFIKIDKSFIDNITRFNNGLSVVNAIQKMAESLNIKVVAEGVESIEQYKILKNIGIEYIQGYLTGKPQDPSDDLNFAFNMISS